MEPAIVSVSAWEDRSDRRRAPGERRGCRRLPFVAAVRHRLGSPVSLQVALSANLGLTGMQVSRCTGPEDGNAYAAGLTPSTPVQVAFQLPDGGALVELCAEVVFDRPQGARLRTTGLRFGERSPDVDERLRSFLHRSP